MIDAFCHLYLVILTEKRSLILENIQFGRIEYMTPTVLAS